MTQKAQARGRLVAALLSTVLAPVIVLSSSTDAAAVIRTKNIMTQIHVVGGPANVCLIVTVSNTQGDLRSSTIRVLDADSGTRWVGTGQTAVVGERIEVTEFGGYSESSGICVGSVIARGSTRVAADDLRNVWVATN